MKSIKVGPEALEGFRVAAGWGSVQEIEADSFARVDPINQPSMKKRRGSSVRNRSSYLDPTVNDGSERVEEDGVGFGETIGQYETRSFLKKGSRRSRNSIHA